MLPDAFIQHRIGNARVRLKIPDRKGYRNYFLRLTERLDTFAQFRQCRANHCTGTLLIEDSRLDLQALDRFAEQEGLFRLHHTRLPARPFAAQVAAPIETVSSKIRKLTGGELDMPGALFIVLLTTGLIEIARGRLSSPPWYSAFWYAFGLYSKGLLDRVSASAE